MTGLSGEACALVLRRLAELRSLPPTVIRDLPPDAREVHILSGFWTDLEVYSERISDGAMAVVVRAFIHTYRWPTFLSFSGVGRVLADGFVLGPDDSITTAPDELLWQFR